MYCRSCGQAAEADEPLCVRCAFAGATAQRLESYQPRCSSCGQPVPSEGTCVSCAWKSLRPARDEQVPQYSHGPAGRYAPVVAERRPVWIRGMVIGWMNLAAGLVMLVLVLSAGGTAKEVLLGLVLSLAASSYGLFIIVARPRVVWYSGWTFLLPLGAALWLISALGS